MRKRLFVLLLFVLWLSFPGEIRAQTEISFSRVDIELWPEFDRPEMLVIYQMQLAEDVSLPVELTLRIPASAGEPHALADSVDGDKSYTIEVEGQWAAIHFTANGRIIQLEYYDASFNVEDAQRQYEFTWPVDYPISATRVKIKLPEDVRSVIVPPSYSGPVSGGDGYIYFEVFVGSLQAGEQLSASLGYMRGTNTQQLLAWGLGLAGAVLVFWGGYRYIKATKPSERLRAPRKPSRVKPAGAIFCHNCGERSDKRDKFCRNCGAELRGG
jgi:hypothetical protein